MWIKATDRKPEPRQLHCEGFNWVIVWVGGEYGNRCALDSTQGNQNVGYYLNSIDEWRVLGSNNRAEVTHWQPLPGDPNAAQPIIDEATDKVLSEVFAVEDAEGRREAATWTPAYYVAYVFAIHTIAGTTFSPGVYLASLDCITADDARAECSVETSANAPPTLRPLSDKIQARIVDVGEAFRDSKAAHTAAVKMLEKYPPHV